MDLNAEADAAANGAATHATPQNANGSVELLA